MNLQTYIPLDDAARRYQINRLVLTQAIASGRMRAVQVKDFVAVAEEDMKILAIDMDESLKGVSIRATEAAEKYGVNQPNLNRWADAGYIRVIKHRYSYLDLDEADVKRVATIYKKALQETGSPVKAGWVLKRTMAHFR
ncbi:MAG: hypothetical protein DRP09_20195 [Candidatus Thorarchaeota archaeon]|nr:MAG: hypothetical protein DRP09_20195 [Candidatus Thorarchaeota archaeon]